MLLSGLGWFKDSTVPSMCLHNVPLGGVCLCLHYLPCICLAARICSCICSWVGYSVCAQMWKCARWGSGVRCHFPALSVLLSGIGSAGGAEGRERGREELCLLARPFVVTPPPGSLSPAHRHILLARSEDLIGTCHSRFPV